MLHGNSGFPEIRNSSTCFTGIRNLREALQIFRIPVNSLRQFRIPVETTVIPDLRDCIALLSRIFSDGVIMQQLSNDMLASHVRGLCIQANVAAARCNFLQSNRHLMLKT